MPDTEALRYATDRSGLIHVIVDFRPAAGIYIAVCGARVPARSAEVWRGADPPGILCARCRSVPENDTAT